MPFSQLPQQRQLDDYSALRGQAFDRHYATHQMTDHTLFS